MGFQPGGIQGIPGRLSHHTVRCQALLLLKDFHRPLGGCAVAAIHRHGGQAAVKLGQVGQPELHLLHIAAGAAAPQGGAGPAAGALGAVGGLALAGQLRQVLDADVDIADFEPGAFAHHAVRRQAELLLEFFHHIFGGLIKYAVHGGLAEERVILGNAGKLPLDDAHVGAGAAPPQGAAGIAGGDAGDVIGGDQLHPAAVVVAQNLQGVFALFGAVDGAPLLHARAGDGFAVAILGVVGFPVAAAAHVGVEQFGGQFFHHRKHRAARNVGLVDTRRAGDIKTIAPAGIPLGPDAVKRKADLRENIRAECLFRPGRADSRGCFTYFDKFIIKATPHNSRFTA